VRASLNLRSSALKKRIHEHNSSAPPVSTMTTPKFMTHLPYSPTGSDLPSSLIRTSHVASPLTLSLPIADRRIGSLSSSNPHNSNSAHSVKHLRVWRIVHTSCCGYLTSVFHMCAHSDLVDRGLPLFHFPPSSVQAPFVRAPNPRCMSTVTTIWEATGIQYPN